MNISHLFDEEDRFVLELLFGHEQLMPFLEGDEDALVIGNELIFLVPSSWIVMMIAHKHILLKISLILILLLWMKTFFIQYTVGQGPRKPRQKREPYQLTIYPRYILDALQLNPIDPLHLA